MNGNQPNSVDFKQIQRQFAAFIRNPEQNDGPAGINLERISIYRELFFSNIESFLSANFPVLRSLFNDNDWFALAQDFYATHQCSSPYFAEIPEEFLEYLENEREPSQDLPFMLELAHYEWVEMALSIAPDPVEHTTKKTEHNSVHLTSKFTLSSLAWPLVYRYPVHKIYADFIPDEIPAQNTFLVVYRNHQDEVKFLEIMPMSYNLLSLIEQTPNLAAQDYLQQLQDTDLSITEQANFFDYGLKNISQLNQLGIVINT